MDEAIFKEIASEIKGLNHQAITLISQGRLDEAEGICQRALGITSSLAYDEGAAMVLYNLANLEALRGDLLKAMAYGALCKEKHEMAQSDGEGCGKLLAGLAKTAMKKGMELEKNGALDEALAYYYASVPFSDEKYSQAMQKEIALIERAMSHG